MRIADHTDGRGSNGAGVRRSRVEAIGRFAVRRRRGVFVGAIVFVLLCAGLSGNVVNKLSAGGFDDPNGAAIKAADGLHKRFGLDTPKLVLLVSSSRPVADRQVAAAGRALAARIARETDVSHVQSFWTVRGPAAAQLRSRDGKQALIVAQLAGSDNHIADRTRTLTKTYGGQSGPLTVSVTGYGELVAATHDQVEKDLQKAEALALPLTLLALFLVLRGLVAAALPLAIGIVSILGTLLTLRLLYEVTSVSVFATNVATALGLGLAGDYSLLFVGRYRQELRHGLDTVPAILATMRTAGRTIVFSAVTVAIALASLLVFPMYYLRSFAYAGVAVTVIAAAGALLLMPACLAALGPRINSFSLKRQRRVVPEESGFWYRFSGFVMRHPLPAALAVVALLLVMAAPFLHASFSMADARNLPTSNHARQVSDRVAHTFPTRAEGTMFVLAHTQANAAAASYAKRLSRVDGVVSVDAASGFYRGGRLVAARPAAARRPYVAPGATWLAISMDREPYAEPGEKLGRAVRAVHAPFRTEAAGVPVRMADAKSAMTDRLPLAIAIIVLTTFVALFAMTGSVVAPIKALILNTLSMLAVLGATVWIFQDGHLRWLVGDFTLTGSVNVLNPPLIFAVAFGLSMDYEVFMLSRIKEEYDKTGDNVASVRRGLQRTGPVVTAAAAVMTIVFVAFATSGVVGVKMVGVAMAIAVIIDATLIRATLVPAFMRLAGRLNWWAPAPLRRVQDRLGLAEGERVPATQSSMNARIRSQESSASSRL